MEPQDNVQTSQEISKKKIHWGNVAVLIILLVILGIISLYFLTDESVIRNCNAPEDCGIYDVFYVTGQGYICANSELISDNSIKTKAKMFKYASRNSIKEQPEECICEQNVCEMK